jgi:hypothetical protein
VTDLTIHSFKAVGTSNVVTKLFRTSEAATTSNTQQRRVKIFEVSLGSLQRTSWQAAKRTFPIGWSNNVDASTPDPVPFKNVTLNIFGAPNLKATHRTDGMSVHMGNLCFTAMVHLLNISITHTGRVCGA